MANQFTKTKRIKKLPLIAILGNFTRKTVDLTFLILVSKSSIPDHTTAPARLHRPTRFFVLRQEGIGRGGFSEVLARSVVYGRQT